MALIRTTLGDLEASVSTTGPFMASEQIAFDVPVDDPLVVLGAFNAWQPLAVRLYDGNARDGSSAVDIACWVVTAERTNDTLHVTANDAAKWFERRSAVRITSGAQPVGQHVLDLFANVVSNREERPIVAIVPSPTDTVDNDDSSWFYWVPFTKPDGTVIQVVYSYQTMAPMGTPWGSVHDHDGTHTAANRRAMLYTAPFTTASAPTRVRVRLWSYMSPNVIWTNTLEVSTDQGQTWGTSYPLAQTSHLAEQWIDITGDHTWTAADLAKGIYLRFTEQTNVDDPNPETVWNLFYVGVQCDFATNITDSWPVRMAQIDGGGPVVTLPANERKSFLDWLKYLADQTGYEWAVQSDFNQLGTAGLAWQQRIGTDINAAVVLDGVATQVAALEEGQVVRQVAHTAVDGMVIYSQVRVTAQGLTDVVVTDALLAADIGVHETIIDLGANATATDQAKFAAQQLTEVANPVMALSLVLGRVPGLWSSLVSGNSALAVVSHAPVNAWQGQVRIVGRAFDEGAGTATLDVLTVRDLGTSTQAVGSGHTVLAAVNTRKRAPTQQSLNRFRDLLQLIRREAR